MRSHYHLDLEKKSSLKARWQSLLQPFQVEQRLSQKVLLDLVKAYSSAGRFYHTLEHIQQVLCTIEDLRKTLSHPTLPNYAAIEFAAWFHDVIYDPRTNNNETKSAEYAVDVLKRIGILPEIINGVYSLIMKTQKHQEPDNIEGQIFLDADLSILGASACEYSTYAQAIRKEYSWMPHEEYQARRKQVLQSFLIRERIYFTDQMFTALESKARQNIQEEIKSLSPSNVN